jgi:uncharacterized membrane protein
MVHPHRDQTRIGGEHNQMKNVRSLLLFLLLFLLSLLLWLLLCCCCRCCVVAAAAAAAAVVVVVVVVVVVYCCLGHSVCCLSHFIRTRTYSRIETLDDRYYMREVTTRMKVVNAWRRC